MGTTGLASQRPGRAIAGMCLMLVAVGALLTAPLAAQDAEDPLWAATATAVDQVTLSRTGYREFLRGIDDRHVAFAQRYADFNPRRVAVSQGPSQVFVWHYTVTYFNRDGPAARPVGRASPRQLVRSMARRPGVCCGVNWFIDRDARVFRLAPLNAKLRHNPPFDRIVTGVEVEASSQDVVTPAQYEQLAYLTVHVLGRQGLVAQRPLRQAVRGHGEMRDAYLQRHPQARWGERDDFDAPAAALLRRKIVRFLDGTDG